MTKRILVVDDEVDFSELLKFRLRQLDYEVVTAATGSEALNRARRQLPDAILLDLMLPDLDGLMVCEILGQQPSTCDTPVFMITAITSAVIAEAARNAGARGFFTKPLNFDALKRQLEVTFAETPNNAALYSSPG
jgi:CheY-like chemotaxis protein